jgi:predicted XRE-type DNA-binding protein
MKKSELVKGSANAFEDFGLADSETLLLKAKLAGLIVKVLDSQKLSVRAAAERTGIAAADFSRIRNVRLERFTVDRLMAILARLGRQIEVAVRLKPQSQKRSVAA